MTAQPDAPTRTDLEILQALDFQPAIPCEWKKFGRPCGTEAALMVTLRPDACPCTKPPMATCTGCWGLLARDPRGCWHCASCLVHVGFTRDETFVIVCTLGGAS